MSAPKLIAVYAGYGDTLLLQLPTINVNDKPHFWLIDGGPVGPPIMTPRQKSGRKRPAPSPPSWSEGDNRYNSYYQFLQQALLRFCCSGAQDNTLGFRLIDLLDGIVVTHPHQDHMDGVIQLLTDWLPNALNSPTKDRPLQFKGPIVFNDLFENNKDVPAGYLQYMLEAKGFERKPWDNIPAIPGLLHGTPPGHQLYKMVTKSTSTQFTHLALNLDTSQANISSIITSYRPPNDLDWPIVTTGDTTGEHVLAQLQNVLTSTAIPPEPVKTLSIFKVPHHGSQRNSHVASRLSITDKSYEKPEYFFLALSAWYLGNGEFARTENRTVDPDLAQFREYVQASRVWSWIGYSNGNIPAFRSAIDAASQVLRQYLEVYQFTYSGQQPQLILDGSNWGDWTTFTRLLLERYQAIEESIRNGDPDPTTPSYTSQIASQTVGKFSVDKIKQQTRAYGALDVQGVEKNLVVDIMDVLNYDPFTTLRLIPGIVEFYKRFDARNYIISGTRKPHNHPSPTVVAAIMKAAFDRSDSIVRQLFVTDAWGLNIEEILHYLKFLAPTITKDQWKNKIKVFYLDQDYIAAVPIDSITDVPGCTEFDINEATDSSDLRYELHTQFSRVDAYNTPFSTWLAQSNFSITVLDPDNPVIPFGSLTIIGSPIQFDLVVQPGILPLIQLSRTGPPGGTLNGSIFQMALVGSSPILIFPNVTFQLGKRKWASTEPRWYQLVSGQEILCYSDNGTAKTLTFEPLTSTPTNVARLHFETSSIQTMNQARQKHSMNVSLAIQSNDSTEESFASWWTSAAPDPTLSPVTLLDVSDVVLGEHLATALYVTVNEQLTAFAGVAGYSVDIDASPPVVHGVEGTVLVKPLLKFPSGIQLSDPNGGNSVAVASLLGEISSSNSSLALHAQLSTEISTECNFSFVQELPLILYLQAVGFKGSPDQVSIAGIAGSIAGFEQVLGFFSLMPSSILSTIELPTWLVNKVESEISFEMSPIGADVQDARLVAVIPAALKNIKVGGLVFSVKNIFLHLVQTDSWSSQHYDIALCMDLSLGTEQSNFSLSLVITQDSTGQVTLSFTGAPSSISLGSLFNELGFSSPSAILLPFGGPDAMSGIPDLVGFVLSVPCSGSSIVTLQSIFAQLGKDGWHPWEEILPEIFWPKDSTVTITGVITQPQSYATLAVGLQLDFSIPLTDATANILLSATYWPKKSNNNDPTQRTKLGINIDPDSSLPAPSINDILEALIGSSWSALTAAIPLLQQLTTAISITQVLVELEQAPNNAPKIASFSISALISNLKLLSNLIVENAVLDITYTGSTWHAEIKTTMLFADQYRCQTLLILPTKDIAGKFEFTNLDDTFTFGAFVKEIDSTIDITTIPVIGSDTLGSITLSFFSITAAYVDSALAVTSFAVQIDWEISNIEQLDVSNNHLTINWSRTPFRNPPSIAGQPEPGIGKENIWRVDWEGFLSNSWMLSAGLQYTHIVQDSQESKSELVLAGSILNLATQDVSASDLTNSLTGDNTGPSRLWQESVPSGTEFSLQRLAVNCVFGNEQIYGIGAQALWGKHGTGNGILVVRNIKPAIPTDSHWAFMLAVSVNDFHIGDLIVDTDLAQTIDANLTITNASVLAFYEPVAKTLEEIKEALDNVKTTHLLPSNSVIPLEGFSIYSSLKATAGFSIFASLSFKPPQADSAMESLNVVANSTLPSTVVNVSGFFSKDDQSNRTIEFSASIESCQILPSVSLSSIGITYSVHVLDNVKSSDFSLVGTCVLNFTGQELWVLGGELNIHSAETTTAKFSFQSYHDSSLFELIGLKVSNVQLSGYYDFSNKADTDINSGTVSYDGNSATYHISLSAVVSLGSAEATLSLIFMSGVPGVLTITAGSLNLKDLFSSIFLKSFPWDLLDISFKKLFMYYAWKPDYTTKPVSDGTGSRNGEYLLGYHAECEAGIYGVQFLLSLDIIGGGDDQSGIKGTATKATPVDVICVTLHGVKDSKTTGPSFGFSTIKGESQGCFIGAGIALFGTTIGDITLSYNFRPPQPASPGFHGQLRISNVDLAFLPNVEVEFELVEKEGKNQLHFVKLPTIFQDFMDAVTFTNTIKDLTAKDKCGALDLIFDEIVKSSINADCKLVDSQEGQDPAEDSSGVKSIAFTVEGKYTLSIGGTDIPVTFKPILFTVNNIPTSLESLGASILDFIKDNIPVLIQGLLDNADAFAQVLALIALKKLTLETVKSLICRDKYKPETEPGDDPDPDQKPDEGMDTDQAGPDGDAGFGGGGGSGTPGAAGGGTSAANAAAGIATGLAGFLFGLFGGIPSSGSGPPDPLPPSPPSPGIPPKAPDNDLYAQIIEEAISKDFERWVNRTDYPSALKDALNGALEYRAAIMLLRQVLENPNVAPKLGKSFFEDYTKRRTYLVYNFSTLSTRFAQKWLDMSTTPITTNVSVNPGGTRQLTMSWVPLRTDDTMVTALTMYLDNKLQIEKQIVGDRIMTVALPPLSLNALNVQARVDAFSAIKGGPPQYQTEYAFFAQGQPASGEFVEPAATVSSQDAGRQPDPPEGLKYVHLIDPEEMEFDDTNYPVFSIANYTYWGLSYDDNSVGLAILAYDQNNNLIRRWDLEGARYLVSITYTPGEPEVVFLGQGSDTITIPVNNLLALPFVTVGDATRQPTPPSGLVYRNVTENGDYGDLTKYPVLVLGAFSYWSVSNADGSASGALLIFDTENELVKRADFSSLVAIYAIQIDENEAVFRGPKTGRPFGFDELEDMVKS